MAALVTIVALCLAGTVFCVRLLVALQRERQRVMVCYVLYAKPASCNVSAMVQYSKEGSESLAG